MDKYFLGIDTSNYTTSIALVDQLGNVIADKRKMLEVKKGNRGLRQSEAFFQHIKNIPVLYEECIKEAGCSNIKAVAVSTKPRNISDSYMPVFTAGENFAKVIADTLNIPLYKFSHQEGHIKAIEHFNNQNDEFICFHLSGGTTEILKVFKIDNMLKSEIIGGSLDISFGQLIDRIGVALGYDFPAGKIMDQLALKRKQTDIKLKHIKINGLKFNLSGIETQIIRQLEEYSKEEIAYSLFTEILLCLQKLVKNCKKNFNGMNILFAGGVSQSEFLKTHLENQVVFGKYGADNALGIALLGGIAYGN